MTMNLEFVVFGLLFLAGCLALDESASAKILHSEFDNIGTGSYNFRFQTSDGLQREERGHLEDENTEDEALIVHGSYSYTGPDGILYSVRYTADRNGFHPEGDHIKVPPFVPWNPRRKNNPGDNQNEEQKSDNVISGGINQINQYLPSTPRPAIKPEYIPSSPRPPVLRGGSGGGLNVVAQVVPGRSATLSEAGFTAEASPRAVPFGDLDPNIQSSILNLLENGDGRGLNIQAINSI